MDVTSEALALVGTELKRASTTIGQALIQLGLREQMGDRIAVELPSLGISVSTDLNDVVRSVHLYAEGANGYSQFPFSLQGIDMSSTRQRVHEALGPPVGQGAGSVSANLSRSGDWEVYRIGSNRVHIEYAFDVDKIRLVTLTKGAPLTEESARGLGR